MLLQRPWACICRANDKQKKRTKLQLRMYLVADKVGVTAVVLLRVSGMPRADTPRRAWRRVLLKHFATEQPALHWIPRVAAFSSWGYYQSES